MNRKRPTQAKPGKIIALPLRRSKYQIFPAHPPDRHEALKASTINHGVEQPTIWDDEGNLLDGWEREVICQELRITCPREVRHFASEAEKFQFVLAVNAHRRPNLNQKEKRAVIEGYLQGDPGVADNLLGQTLGVSKNTVLAVRGRLEASGHIPKVEKTKGKDGKLRPVRYTKRIITNTPKEFAKAQEIIKDLPDYCAGKTLDITTAQRRARNNRTTIERNSRPIEPLPADAIRLYHCRFQELEKKACITPGTVNLILTDIPYDKSFLPQVSELGALAKRWLADGGLFVCMTGQYYFNEFIQTMDRFLTYRWLDTSIWRKDATPVRVCGKKIISKSKPIVVYSRGPLTKGAWCDVHEVNVKEKQWHPMQQPLELFEQLVRFFSNVGDLVVDPCGGGFTTAEACLRLARQCIICDVDARCVSKGQERLECARKSMRVVA